MPKVRPETLREVEQALQRYTDAVEQSEISVTTKAGYIINARRFVHWLNDDYEPGARTSRPIRRRG